MLYLVTLLCLVQPNQPPPILPQATKMMKQLDTWPASEKIADTLKTLEETKRIVTAPKREMDRDRTVRTGKDLDMLWADFFATSEYAPISRILDSFESNVPPGFKNAARWSLESNMGSHTKLVKLVKEHLKERGETSKAEVEKMLGKMKGESGTYYLLRYQLKVATIFQTYHSKVTFIKCDQSGCVQLLSQVDKAGVS
ncbi:MAG TPA: hypothetical protein PLN21_08850 [Gemmatales bacterium]|nr:hypothetical protein [Gemmatales bacterium]